MIETQNGTTQKLIFFHVMVVKKKSYRKAVYGVFGKYKASEMGMQKYHMMDHLVESMRQMVGQRFCRVEFLKVLAKVLEASIRKYKT